MSEIPRIAASIEVAPRQALASEDLPGLFPLATRVYVTDLGTDGNDTLAAAAKRLRGFGYEPVPHFAARRLTGRTALEDRLERMRGEADVSDVLVIGGGMDRPAGPFASTMEVLETGLLDRHGIAAVGVAGHPETSPDFSAEEGDEALRLKQAFAERTGAQVRIVTQFGFDAAKFIRWADGLRALDIDMPVHVGVAGPAKIATLIRYATLCGVGASVSFLKKNAMALAALATAHSPEGMVKPIEAHVNSGAPTPIRQIHVFPFGGLRNARDWLVRRGSWSPDTVTAGALAPAQG